MHECCARTCSAFTWARNRAKNDAEPKRGAHFLAATPVSCRCLVLGRRSRTASAHLGMQMNAGVWRLIYGARWASVHLSSARRRSGVVSIRARVHYDERAPNRSLIDAPTYRLIDLSHSIGRETDDAFSRPVRACFDSRHAENSGAIDRHRAARGQLRGDPLIYS